jgi:hypothetical protein
MTNGIAAFSGLSSAWVQMYKTFSTCSAIFNFLSSVSLNFKFKSMPPKPAL